MDQSGARLLDPRIFMSAGLTGQGNDIWELLRYNSSSDKGTATRSISRFDMSLEHTRGPYWERQEQSDRHSTQRALRPDLGSERVEMGSTFSHPRPPIPVRTTRITYLVDQECTTISVLLLIAETLQYSRHESFAILLRRLIDVYTAR